MSAADDKQLAGVARPPVGMAQAQPRRRETVPTGFAALDAGLPGGGWPRHGLVEILTPRPASARLYLLLPVLAALSRATPARWCTWVSPPHEPFAPALRGAWRGARPHARSCAVSGLTPHDGKRRRSDGVHMGLWALEQALRSGACGMALAWLPRASPRAIRRLQLAAEQGRALGVLYRSQRFRAPGIPGHVARAARAAGTNGGRHGARVRSAQESRRQPRAHRLHWTAAAA